MQTGQQARQPRPDRAFWPGAGRGDILDQISTALMRAGAVVVLTGGAAMGKTRLALEATARVEAAAIPCRTVAGDRQADLTAIINEMARLPQPGSTDTKARALLVVDQAELAGAQTLEQLILIAERTSIAVMLIGRAELVGILVRSVPERVCDSITRYVALEPLDAVQIAEFIVHLLGEETSPVTCGDDAFRRIVALSHGVPGAIDRLMTDAVRLARLSRSSLLTATVIDMIADDEHPPGEQRHPWREPSAKPPVHPFRRQAKPVATAQPAPQQSAIVARSMQTILTDLQERPDIAPSEDGGEDTGQHGRQNGGQHGGQDGQTIPEWPTKSSAKPHRPPARPARRVPPWAGGMAFVVAATSVIALQQYLQSGAPILALTDRSRAVVSSLVGDTTIRPAVTSDDSAPAPVEPVPSAAEPAPVMDDTPMVQVAVVESPMLSPPMINGEAQPRDVQATVPEEAPKQPAAQALPQALPMTPVPSEEPVAEPAAETAPDVQPSPLEPAPTAQFAPEPYVPSAEELPLEALPPEEFPPEALLPEEFPPEALLPEIPLPEALPPAGLGAIAPAEPSLPEPTAESPPEQVPADTATEIAPPDATEPSIPETPPPESPAAEMSPPVEPAPLEPPAAVAVPEPAPQEPAPEHASPPEPEPEPTVAEPSPPPEPQEPAPEQAMPAEPEPEPAPEPTVAEPSPPMEPAEPPAPEPAIVTAAPPPPPPPSTPAPVAPKPPSVAESVLLERGDRLLAIGDIASARLLYETAATGGSARGALLAGRTLDPGYLRSLGARGVTGDPTRAAAWYEKAAELGDDSATALLEALGRR